VVAAAGSVIGTKRARGARDECREPLFV
jgi:hypothetical protein